MKALHQADASNSPQGRCHTIKGKSIKVAMQTLSQAVAKGPNSAAPIRMNKNEAPQSAPNIK
jgi:hypothetical protein